MAAMGSMTTPRRTGCGIANIMPAAPATGDARKHENVTRTAWRGVGRYVKTRSALFRRAKGSMANRRALRVVSGPADARSRDPSWATGLLRGGELEPQVKLKELPDRDRQQHEAPGPQGPGDRR